MEKIKKMVNTIKKNYKFDRYDAISVITVLNIVLMACGVWWAPLFGFFNCALFISFTFVQKVRISAWISQVALVIVNGIFLTW